MSTPSEMVKIELLQKKVDDYQHDPELCASLSATQCQVLAELQIIYNILTKRSLSNVPAIYSNTCKGITDIIKQSNRTYVDKEPPQLCGEYLQKYQNAKQTAQLTNLSDV